MSHASAENRPLLTQAARPPLQFLDCGGISIAARHRPAAAGAAPIALFWLSGYRSDMEGTKAQAVDAFAEAQGIAATRFDYSGHGHSGGDFYQGTISLWLSQALAVFEHFYGDKTIRPLIIGSSMGGWLALRMAQELQKRGRQAGGLVLLAPAPDFTETLVKPVLQEQHRNELRENGFFIAEEHGSPTPYSRALLEDGPNNRIMGEELLQFSCPIHIMQGMADDIVPYRHTMRLMEYLPLADVTLTLIKDGDHRLSTPQNIIFLQKLLENFIPAV